MTYWKHLTVISYMHGWIHSCVAGDMFVLSQLPTPFHVVDPNDRWLRFTRCKGGGLCLRFIILVGGLEHFYFSRIYGMSSFPLTNSHFSRWLVDHQPVIAFAVESLSFHRKIMEGPPFFDFRWNPPILVKFPSLGVRVTMVTMACSPEVVGQVGHVVWRPSWNTAYNVHIVSMYISYMNTTHTCVIMHHYGYL